jgi:hypothetical protein
MIRAMAVRLLLIVLAAPVVVGQIAGAERSPHVDGEEFVGPFPSWSNARSYGAAGDGTTDDTAALQSALSDLGRPDRSPVLYLPAGRYRITRTLSLSRTIDVSIVGEDPQRVSIIWDGADGGTMLHVNGVAYSRFTRLTYDGRRRASVAVEQSWDNVSPHFDTGNEYSDHVFVDVGYGIRGGFYGHGFAETSIVRSRFVRNTTAGVALGNFNALDAWVWSSTFEDCAVGVSNEPGAGNFRVYASTFRRSTIADLSMQNTGGFSARGNYSIGSKAFYISGAPINHPATIEIQGNTILDPLDPVAIRLGNQGPGLLLDNIIRSRPNVSGPIVRWRTLVDADVVSVGNTFTAVNAVTANGRLLAIDDRVVVPAAIHAPEPALPDTPRSRGRMVFEVPAGAGAAAIQQTIDTAATSGGSRPIVHLPYGTYSIAATLTIPPSDLQLVGDGASRLRWTGQGRGPVIRLESPSRATLRELEIDGAGKADGLVAEDVDQEGARVYLEGVQLRRGRETNLLVERISRAELELVDVGHAYSDNGVSVKVAGGKATIFSGASSANRLTYEVSDGGSLLVRDTWYEGLAPNGFASVHGRAVFTMQGSRVASPADGVAPAFRITDLDGRVALLTTHIDDRIVVEGDGSRAEVLALGAFREYRDSPFLSGPPASSGRAARSGSAIVALSRQRAKTQGRFSRGSIPIPDSENPGAEFVRRLLGPARERVTPLPLTRVSAGAADIRLFRVRVDHGLNNIRLAGAPPANDNALNR